MSSLETEMLAFIETGLAQHDRVCPMPATAILLHPGNYELCGWNELWGIPVKPDDRVEPKRFEIECAGSALGIEDAIEEFLEVEAPQEPVTVEPLSTPVGPTA